MITIIDNGGANIASITDGFARLGVQATLSCDANIIKKSTHVILPGVGTAAYAMQLLKEKSLIELVRSLTQPVLGICLGMQLLYDASEEGEVSCLGLITGKVKKIIKKEADIRIPHMGWNKLNIIKNHAIFKDIPNESFVYFVHGYAALVDEYTTAMVQHGENFTAAVQHHNFFGTQFHPERSGPIGSQILKNFLELI